MSATNDISKIPGAILDNAQGIRAETLVAHAVAGGASREAFLVSAEHFFGRDYIHDVAQAAVFEDEWMRSLVQLKLSRPGFYDMLPEGLFFQPAGAEFNSSLSVAEMAAIYRENKIKEKGIRQFFQPFEQAGFFQQLQIEEEERALLSGLEQGMLHQYFRKFWDLPETISDQVAGYFVLLIPYAHRICGYLPLMQECLDLLLPDPVVISHSVPQVTPVGKHMETGLGEQLLGGDMVCGNSFMEEYPALRYAIGPLVHSKITDYLPGGSQYLVMETFDRFFVPVEAVTETVIEINRQAATLVLDPQQEPILGYSSVLGTD